MTTTITTKSLQETIEGQVGKMKELQRAVATARCEYNRIAKDVRKLRRIENFLKKVM